MDDLISRQALLEFAHNHVGGMIDCNDIARFPAAEAEPVRHGRWNYKWDAEKDPERLFVRIVCSECNLHTGQLQQYCPNCGAKMDGKEE